MINISFIFYASDKDNVNIPLTFYEENFVDYRLYKNNASKKEIKYQLSIKINFFSTLGSKL